MNFIYLPSGPETIHLKPVNPELQHNHLVETADNTTYLWPTQFNSEAISPKSYYALKNELNITSITIYDIVKGLIKQTEIKDHLNQSGINFLRGQTPFKSFPTFPDVTHIYNTENKNGIVTHTVGPDRFKLTTKTETPISKSIGIVSPVWHYIGVKVKGVGVKPSLAQL